MTLADLAADAANLRNQADKLPDFFLAGAFASDAVDYLTAQNARILLIESAIAGLSGGTVTPADAGSVIGDLTAYVATFAKAPLAPVVAANAGKDNDAIVNHVRKALDVVLGLRLADRRTAVVQLAGLLVAEAQRLDVVAGGGGVQPAVLLGGGEIMQP